MGLEGKMKGVRERRVPLRTCVGCKSVKPKQSLVRIVRAPSGDINVDISGKANGRGGYLCPDKDCFFKATKKGALAKALNVNINESKLRQLEMDFLCSIEERDKAVE